MLTLYDVVVSGNCYKVRLLLNILTLPHQVRDVNLFADEQHSKAYQRLNPFAQVPVLDDEGRIIRDSQAILVYLAKQYGTGQWWPESDAYRLAQIVGWLSTAANEIAQGPASLRVHRKFGRTINVVQAQQVTAKILAIIDQHLASQDWLVGDTVSIADLAVYPYLALSPEGGVNIEAHDNIINWFRRISALSNYVGMPGLWQE